MSCSLHCAGSCNRLDGACIACVTGRHGNYCAETCGHCSTVSCAQFTAVCDDDCSDGYFGLDCKSPCAQEACKRCNRVTGQCETCKYGRYGADCELNCSGNCGLSDDGNIYCDKQTGACIEKACQPGFYNLTCDIPCSGNCAVREVDASVHCYFENGHCLDGCKDGWYGSKCDSQCSPNCAGQLKLCNQTGYCTLGCVEEWYGDRCNRPCSITCTDNKCDRNLGYCTSCVTGNNALCRDEGIRTSLAAF